MFKNFSRFLKLTGFFISLAAFSLSIQVASAATLTANGLFDLVDGADGICTFREAFMATEQNANLNECQDTVNPYGADTILLKNGTYDVSLLGNLIVTGDLTILGTGETNNLLNGQSMNTHFIVQQNGVLTLKNLTIIQFSSTTHGGAIHISTGGTVKLTSVTISKSSTTGHGGGIFNQGTLTMDKITITLNSSKNSGGGLSNDGNIPSITNSTFSYNSADDGDPNTAEFGGGINNSTINGSITSIDGTTITNNTATYGGGLYNRGIQITTITNSTFDSNVASFYGGAIFNGYGDILVQNSSITNNTAIYGGGIKNWNGANNKGNIFYLATIINSTISGNIAKNSGGGIANSGNIKFINDTIIKNSASLNSGGDSYGAGIHIYNGPGDLATVEITNTILADNKSGLNLEDDCSSSPLFLVKSGGSNIVGSGNKCSGWISNGGAGNDILNVANSGIDPNLTNNGGTTLTHALLAGSPALDAGNSNACPVNDQRGVLRATQGGAACDIGAYEMDVVNPVLTEQTPVSPNPTNNKNPAYVFTTNEDGILALSGGCGTTTTSATAGTITLTLNNTNLDSQGLADGDYSCTITVTDSHKNVGILVMTPFTINTVAVIINGNNGDGSGGGGGGGSGGGGSIEILQLFKKSNNPNSPVNTPDNFVGGGSNNTEENPHFPYIENDKAGTAIEKFIADCGVDSYKDKTGKLIHLFKPNFKITRADLLFILIRCKYGVSPKPASKPFPDVPLNHPAIAEITLAKEKKIIQGYPNRNFKPGNYATRAEAFKMIQLAWLNPEQIKTATAKSTCRDVVQSEWYAKYFNYAQSKKTLQEVQNLMGRSPEKCLPGNKITHRETAQIIVKTKEL